MHTYDGNGTPIPSFSGEPYEVALENTARENAEKFAGIWRQRGGSVDLRLYEGAVHGFIRAPYDADSQDALARIRDFIRRMTS